MHTQNRLEADLKINKLPAWRRSLASIHAARVCGTPVCIGHCMDLQAGQGRHKPMEGMSTHLCLEYRYELQHLVRTHMGSDDESYSCIFQQEDSQGNKGVKLDKVHPPCCKTPASIASGSAVSNSPH